MNMIAETTDLSTLTAEEVRVEMIPDTIGAVKEEEANRGNQVREVIPEVVKEAREADKEIKDNQTTKEVRGEVITVRAGEAKEVVLLAMTKVLVGVMVASRLLIITILHKEVKATTTVVIQTVVAKITIQLGKAEVAAVTVTMGVVTEVVTIATEISLKIIPKTKDKEEGIIEKFNYLLSIIKHVVKLIIVLKSTNYMYLKIMTLVLSYN